MEKQSSTPYESLPFERMLGIIMAILKREGQNPKITLEQLQHYHQEVSKLILNSSIHYADDPFLPVNGIHQSYDPSHIQIGVINLASLQNPDGVLFPFVSYEGNTISLKPGVPLLVLNNFFYRELPDRFFCALEEPSALAILGIEKGKDPTFMKSLSDK